MADGIARSLACDATLEHSTQCAPPPQPPARASSGEAGKRGRNEKGVNGVRLKHFERVVASILPTIVPTFVPLPPPPPPPSPPLHRVDKDDSTTITTATVTTATREAETLWPFDARLPSAARVCGPLPGQLSNRDRATRKEDQVRSMLRVILPLIPIYGVEEEEERTCTIVDFGGGSGHLSIPLALLRPSCTVVCVDLSSRSLELLHDKAAHCACVSDPQQHPPTLPIVPNIQQRTHILNLFTYHGAADTYTDQPVDVAVALHLCGEATDVVLRFAGKLQASAIVVAPCCVGKLAASAKNPYVYQATGCNIPTVQYPQSRLFRQLVVDPNDWNALAKAADYSSVDECRTSRNATRRTAKALLETDRRLYLQETFGYVTVLSRMEPWEATPKNDIVAAWLPPNNYNCAATPPPPPFTAGLQQQQQQEMDHDCQVDIQLTVDHLLIGSSKAVIDNDQTESPSSCSAMDGSVDWTWKEEQQIRRQLILQFPSAVGAGGGGEENDKVVIFPTRMGGRRRKLVHYVAEQMGLAHWCQGSKYADKTVAVARTQETMGETVCPM